MFFEFFRFFYVSGRVVPPTPIFMMVLESLHYLKHYVIILIVSHIYDQNKKINKFKGVKSYEQKIQSTKRKRVQDFFS